MDERSKESQDLAKIEKEIEKKITPIKPDQPKKSTVDLKSLRKIAQKIQKFEDGAGVISVTGR